MPTRKLRSDVRCPPLEALLAIDDARTECILHFFIELLFLSSDCEALRLGFIDRRSGRHRGHAKGNDPPARRRPPETQDCSTAVNPAKIGGPIFWLGTYVCVSLLTVFGFSGGSDGTLPARTVAAADLGDHTSACP